MDYKDRYEYWLWNYKNFYVLIIICIYYIFDYGHQIQLDSKGKIYGEVESNE